MPAPEPDGWLDGRLSLRQPPRGAHRAGLDAVLLARLFTETPAAGGDVLLCDLGAGTGAVGLACAREAPGCQVVLAERDPDLAALARLNVAENGLDARVRVAEADVLAPASRRGAGLAAGFADWLLTNPPYFEGRGHRPSPVAGRAGAHAFPPGAGLEAWMRACADLLRPGGCLGVIHRADALPRCLDALRGRFGAVAVRPVQTGPARPAIRVLIHAVKGSRAPFALLPPLVLGDDAASGRNARRTSLPGAPSQ